jgi:signal transduction histidine kinase
MLQKCSLFFVLFLIFYAGGIHAQNVDNKTIDSLKTALKQVESYSEKADLLIKLSYYSDYIGPDKAIGYANLGMSYAKKTNNERQIGDAYANLGAAYEIKSDYVKSLSNLYEALKIIEKSNNLESLIKLYNNIGLIYIDLKNYKQGLVFYNKALILCYQTNNEKKIGLLLNNIGDVYLNQNNNLKAINYFYKSLIINKKLDVTVLTALNLTNIGLCYINLKNYEKGLEMFTKAADIYGEDLNVYKTFNNYEFGKAYYAMSQDEKYKDTKNILIDKSISLFENVLQDFINYNRLKDIQETYFYLYKGYKSRGDIVKALSCFEKHSTLKDSIFSKDSEKKLANLEFQREIDLRDKRIDIQTLRIKSDSRKVYLLITLACAVAGLLGLFLYLYLSKKRNNQLLKEKNKLISNINRQKDKFYSIIAHDLRGPFYGFLGLAELMEEDIDCMSPDEIKFAASNMRSSAKNLLNLLENLLEWSRMEQNLIPFEPKEYSLKPIISDSIITLQNSAEKKEINIQTQIPAGLAVFADKNMFQAVIRNVVLNGIKFTPKKGTILIQASEDLENLIFSVKDSGIGMNQKMIDDLFKIDAKNNRIGTENELSTGLGLILCKEFIDKHNGQIWVESEVGIGSTFNISIPKSKMN